VVADSWLEYRELLRSLGESKLGAVATLLWDLRFTLLTIVMAGFGRASSEVGAVIIVGGNIDGVTRVMTTTIALDAKRRDLYIFPTWLVSTAAPLPRSVFLWQTYRTGSIAGCDCNGFIPKEHAVLHIAAARDGP
jgi:hypothetical protein